MGGRAVAGGVLTPHTAGVCGGRRRWACHGPRPVVDPPPSVGRPQWLSLCCGGSPPPARVFVGRRGEGARRGRGAAARTASAAPANAGPLQLVRGGRHVRGRGEHPPQTRHGGFGFQQEGVGPARCATPERPKIQTVDAAPAGLVCGRAGLPIRRSNIVQYSQMENFTTNQYKSSVSKFPFSADHPRMRFVPGCMRTMQVLHAHHAAGCSWASVPTQAPSLHPTASIR